MALELIGKTHSVREAEILSEDALEFIKLLHEKFAATRNTLLELREANRQKAEQTGTLDFLPETEHVRKGDWKVAETPHALLDRRVEITGPASPAKMAINALNSGAKVWLADLEDASTPTWHNILDAVANLRDGAKGVLTYTSDTGKHYSLRDDIEHAVIIPRPRGWHLNDNNILINGEPAIGALVDFGLLFFHTAKILIAKGHGPYYYLPKMESFLEARLWNDIFVFAQEHLTIEHGTIRATVLIETIPAAFQMDEILYELRDHAAGLNAGRWDYLFSIIKYFRESGENFLLPDRDSITMTAPFMRAYTELLVKTCHGRGAFAMGGMAAVIPNRNLPEVTRLALEKVRADKTREATDGFDGSWVAHPDLVPVCQDVFDAALGSRHNNVEKLRDDVTVTAQQLLDFRSAEGTMTEAGLRKNLNIAVAYTAAWLSGSGAVALNNLMEDAATAEISRSQVWQQLKNRVTLADTKTVISRELVSRILEEETAHLLHDVRDKTLHNKYVQAHDIVHELCLSEHYSDFLTSVAYEFLDKE